MKNHTEPFGMNEDRGEFQLDRLILFSDAVFAIAITLLIIEIKTPVLPEYTSAALLHALREKFSEFLAFLLSFAVIGVFWVSHHRLFGYVTGYTTRLLWLNLHMLLWIVFVPFTSGLNSHFGGMDIVWIIYSLNMFMISTSIYFMYRYISRNDLHISTLAGHPAELRHAQYRNIATCLIFLSGALLCLLNWKPASWVARFIFLLIPVAIRIVNRKMSKKKKKFITEPQLPTAAPKENQPEFP